MSCLQRICRLEARVHDQGHHCKVACTMCVRTRTPRVSVSLVTILLNPSGSKFGCNNVLSLSISPPENVGCQHIMEVLSTGAEPVIPSLVGQVHDAQISAQGRMMFGSSAASQRSLTSGGKI
jgi:hypothetical protein